MNPHKIFGFSIGPILSAALSLALVPLIAWEFSAEDVGRFNVLQTAISFCMLFFSLGLDQAYVREFHESKNQSRLLTACFLPGFAVLLFFSAGGAMFSEKIATALFGINDPSYYFVTVGIVIPTFIVGFLSSILRMQERAVAFSIAQIIPKVILLLSIIGVVYWNSIYTFAQLQSAVFLSSLVTCLAYFWITRTQWVHVLNAGVDWNQVYDLLKFGAPLVFSGLAYWGLAATSVITLRTVSTYSELALYSVSMSFAGIAIIFQSIFSAIWAPTVYKWVANGTDLTRVHHITQQVLAIVCVLFAVCGLFSWLVEYILPDYYVSVRYLLLCSIVQPLLYTLSEVTCVGIGISRRTLLNVWITVAALLVNIALNLSWVPQYGARGAVIANAIAFAVFFVARTETSARVWRSFPRIRLYIAIGTAIGWSIGSAAHGTTLSGLVPLTGLALLLIYGIYFRIELMQLFCAGRIALSARVQ